MVRNYAEKFLQKYLIKNNNLNSIDKKLSFIEEEKKIPGGRIDIYASKGSKKVALELKAAHYNTKTTCLQLINYINFITPIKGEVYFVAPKINVGIYSTLQQYYNNKQLKLFEYTYSKKDGFDFFQVYKNELNDSRKITFLNEILTVKEAKKGIEFFSKKTQKKYYQQD